MGRDGDGGRKAGVWGSVGVCGSVYSGGERKPDMSD